MGQTVADTLSIVAFLVGLFGYMALMMQIGMMIGFVAAWPVNAWLICRGWKEEM